MKLWFSREFPTLGPSHLGRPFFCFFFLGGMGWFGMKLPWQTSSGTSSAAKCPPTTVASPEAREIARAHRSRDHRKVSTAFRFKAKIVYIIYIFTLNIYIYIIIYTYII